MASKSTTKQHPTDAELTSVIYFMANPGKSAFMEPYVKLPTQKFPMPVSKAGLNSVRADIFIPDDSSPEYIKKEVSRWKKSMYSFIGAKSAVYWSINEIKEKTDSDNAYRIMDALRLAVQHYIVPFTHKDVVAVIRSNAEGDLEEILHSIYDVDLKPKVFEPLTKKDIDHIAKELSDYLLSKTK